MWQRRAQSQRRCGWGVVSSPSADVAAASPSPGADVVAASPVPAQMWLGGLYPVPAQMWQRRAHSCMSTHVRRAHATHCYATWHDVHWPCVCGSASSSGRQRRPKGGLPQTASRVALQRRQTDRRPLQVSEQARRRRRRGARARVEPLPDVRAPSLDHACHGPSPARRHGPHFRMVAVQTVRCVVTRRRLERAPLRSTHRPAMALCPRAVREVRRRRMCDMECRMRHSDVACSVSGHA